MASSGVATTSTSGRSRFTFSSSREETTASRPVHGLDQRGMEGFTDKTIPDQRNVDCLNFTHDLLHVIARTP